MSLLLPKGSISCNFITLSFPAVKTYGWKYSTDKIVSSWPVKNETSFIVCLLKIFALLLLVIITTKSLSFFYFLLDFEYFKSIISSLYPTMVSKVESVLLSTCEIFCYADTTKNYFPFDTGKILSTPTSTVLISLLI